MKRTLSLRSDALGELTTEELATVAGGADHTTPLVACVSEAFSCAIYDPNSIVCRVSRLVC